MHQIQRLCRKNDSCVNMTIESKKNKTERSLHPFFLFDLSADPVHDRLGRPDRLETEPWSPDGLDLEPSRPQKRPFRLKGVSKSRNFNFIKILLKIRIHDHEVALKCCTKRFHVGPRAPKQARKSSKVLEKAPLGGSIFEQF